MGDTRSTDRDTRRDKRRAPDKTTHRSAKTDDQPLPHSLLDLQGQLGNQALNHAVQTKLEVTAVSDSSEREADAVARDVVSRLRSSRLPKGGGAPRGAARKPVQPAVGAAGGAVPDDLAAGIAGARGGTALAPDVRAPMEEAFGADFSRVRVHTDSPIAPAISARAFTYGRDLHFAPGEYQPGTAEGQEILAHELTHVVQQDGAVGREVSRFWNSEAFLDATYQNWHTMKSSAQKELVKLIKAFNDKYADGDKAKKPVVKPGLSDSDITAALGDLAAMRRIVDIYVSSKAVEDDSGQMLYDPNRKNRLAGMVDFWQVCNSEINALNRRLADKGRDTLDESALASAASTSASVQKMEAHYEGDVSSAFSKLGVLIDAAVPNPGDTAKVEIEVQIPVSTGVFVGMHLTTEAERGNPGGKDALVKEPLVKSRTEVGFTASGDIGIADLKGELGGYLEAQAKTGADCVTLMSYAMYRRGRESKIIPHELVNRLWGGAWGEFGEKKSEKWSLDVEKQIIGVLGTMPDRTKKPYKNMTDEAYEEAVQGFLADVNSVYVESGGYGSLKGKAGIEGVASLELAVKASTGRRVDFQSLMNRKGGAGEKNVKSDSMFNLTGRAQKATGRGTAAVEASAAVEGGPFKGELKVKSEWMGTGEHAKDASGKKTSAASRIRWTAFEIAFSAAGPDYISETGPVMGFLIEAMVKGYRQASSRVEKEAARAEGAKAIGTGESIAESGAQAIASLAQQDKSIWNPEFKYEQEKLGDKATFGVKRGLKFILKGDVVNGTFLAQLSRTKELGGALPKVFSAKAEKSERLVALAYSKGWKQL